jgi:hypothetical protein
MLTEKISGLLAPRLNHIRSMVEKGAQYLDIVKNIVMSINPKQHGDTMTNMEYLGKKVAEIEHIKWDIAPTAILAAAASLYQDFIDVDTRIQQLISVVENETYSKLIIYNMSSTYTTNIYHMRNGISLTHEKYLEAVLADDESIFSIIFALPYSPDELFSFIVEHDHLINKFTIKMIGITIATTTPERRRRLELIIEEQKDLVLGSRRIDLSGAAGIQGMMVRYNLRPLTRSLVPAALFAFAEAEYNPDVSLDENFVAMAGRGPGVIAINKSTPSPVEFDLSGLIDDKYIMANDLKTNPLSGLTKKIIDRFSTAVLLQRGARAAAVRRYQGREHDKWWIFESINGDLWRVMGRDGDHLIPSSAIQGLLKGVTTRPHQYSSAQESVILSKYLDPLSQLVLTEYEDMKVSPPSSEPIRAAILDRLSTDFEAKISADPPTTAAAARRAAVDRHVINEVLLDILTHSTGVHGKGSAEYLITYIAKFDSIIYDFIKKLERQWGSINLPERVFKELGRAELKSELMTVFRGVTRAVVNELDQSNTWTDYDLSLKEFVLERGQIVV